MLHSQRRILFFPFGAETVDWGEGQEGGEGVISTIETKPGRIEGVHA